MITLGSMKDINPSKYDETWIIVRSLSNKKALNNINTFHVPELSPSPELFKAYLGWKEVDWGQDRFQKSYVPRFIIEMLLDKAAKDKLNELYFKDKAGKSILLVCFCNDEDICHRSVVGGILQGVGCKVISTTYPYFMDYSKYYDMYTQQKSSQ